MEEKPNNFPENNSEVLINTIKEKESKTIYLIKDESLILDIISFIQNPKFNISEKSLLIKYLTNCLVNIPINIEMILSQQKEGIFLYHIIITEYIINHEQKEYKEDIENLLSEILRNIGYDKFMYKCC